MPRKILVVDTALTFAGKIRTEESYVLALYANHVESTERSWLHSHPRPQELEENREAFFFFDGHVRNIFSFLTTPSCITMLSKRVSDRGRGRPKRQRKPLEIYSDDKEEERKAAIKAGLITFPTKKKNGDVSSPAKSSRQRKSAGFEDGLPQKRSYRKKKAYNRHEIGSVWKEQKEAVIDDSHTVEEDVDVKPEPVTTGSSRKRRRPTEASPAKAISTPAKPSISSSKPKANGSTTARTIEEQSWTSRLQDVEGTFLSHSVKLAPILPPTFETTQSLDLEQKYPEVYGKGLGKDSTLEKPTWNPLYSPDVFFDDDYSSDDNLLDPTTLPVTRSITCITTRKPDNQYMAVGDDAGFCIIYSLGTHIRPVARLETVACQQRSRVEQEKLRGQIRKSKGKLRSLVKDTSETTINAIAMVGLQVVLATSCELECMDVPSQSSLWVCPLTLDRIVTSLDMHISTYDVLVSCNIRKQTTNAGRTNTSHTQATSSPLMLLQHSSNNNIEICDANSPLLVKSPCCTAIWDASKSMENRLLFVAVSDTDQELELVLVQGGSIDNWKVACKTRIPVKASNYQTRLRQSPEGTYTLVASSRGIRLYQTETLQLIHTYGDQLALHGKSIVWQDCLLTNSDQFGKQVKKVRENLICEDWLCKDDKERDGQGKLDLGPYIIGIPNFKGPKELSEKLHVWKVEHASTVPAFSLPLPAKAEGVQALVGASINGSDRLVLATRSGVGHTLIPKMKSNFAGIMYPPGYHVVTDNLEYVEDESELDVIEHKKSDKGVVDILPAAGSEEMDEDLKEAMRQSLIEKKSQDEQQIMEDEDVDILNNDTESYPILPCRPEPYLRQFLTENRDEEVDIEKSSNEEEYQEINKGEEQAVLNSGPMFIENFLSRLPNAFKKKELSEDGITVTVKKVVVATSNPISNRPGRGKKSRTTNLESMLKASISPRVQKYMFERQNLWSDGSGSTLDNVLENIVQDLNYKTKDPDIESRDAVQVSPSPTAETVQGEQSSANHNKLEARSTVNTNIRDDEAAVLGLLGLSPNNTKSATQNTPSLPEGKSPASFPDQKIDAEYRSTSISPQNGANASLQINHVVYGAPDSTESSSGKSIAIPMFFNLNSQTPKSKVNCNACRGRSVVHACGKRAMPIDYDEIAKKEKQRKAKEDEEKKKARIQKRKLAEAKKREAKKQKQKEMEELRRREEQEEAERLQRERMSVTAENSSITPPQLSVLHPMVNMGEVVGTTYNTVVSNFQNHASESVGVDYASQFRKATSYTGPPITHNDWGTTERQSSSVESHQNQNQELKTPVAGKLSLQRHTSIGTLSSADALVALAGFAGRSSSLAEPSNEPSNSVQTHTGYGAVHYGTNHNFGAGVQNASISDQSKLGIPSYASLQTTNGTLGAVAEGTNETNTTLSAISAEAESNGNHSTTSYVWPPRSSVPPESYSSSFYNS